VERAHLPELTNLEAVDLPRNVLLEEQEVDVTKRFTRGEVYGRGRGRGKREAHDELLQTLTELMLTRSLELLPLTSLYDNLRRDFASISATRRDIMSSNTRS
jgi:hypothetical protein